MEVKIKNLVKKFDGKGQQKGKTVVAVNNMTFDIPDGKLCGLLGPSGCGKSTTLYMIAGIHTVTEGQVFFGNEDVTKVPPENRGIGLVFQNYALYPHLNVRQNIMFPLSNVTPKLSYDEMCAIALENAKIVDIDKYLDRKPKELSGGQQQRVAIARALAKRPKVLLLDEPLSNLDARLRLQTREEIKRIQKETGITTVFVTHDQEEAMSISDFIVVMKDGVVQQKDEPQKVYEEPANLFVAKFLGTPAINVFDGNIEKGKLYLGGKEVLSTSELDKVHVEEIICPNCGNVVSHNAKYCNVCGTNILEGSNNSNKSVKVKGIEEEFDFFKHVNVPAVDNKKVAKKIKEILKVLSSHSSEEECTYAEKLIAEFALKANEETMNSEAKVVKDKIAIKHALIKANKIEVKNDEEKAILAEVIKEIENVEDASSKEGKKVLENLVQRISNSIKLIPYAHQIRSIYEASDWEGTKKIKENQVHALSYIDNPELDENKERIEKVISSLTGRLNPVRNCKIGIRAEHFVLDNNGPIAVKVSNIEHIGRDISVIGDIEGCPKESSHVKIIISSELIKECEGKDVLHFSVKRLYAFEETGERII